MLTKLIDSYRRETRLGYDDRGKLTSRPLLPVRRSDLDTMLAGVVYGMQPWKGLCCNAL